MSFRLCSRDELPANHPVALFSDFWIDVNHDGDAPTWNRFDPVDHPKLIPWMLLLRPEVDGRLRYAVCGTKCTEVFGMSYQGKLFGEGLPPDAVKTRQEEFTKVIATRASSYSETRLPIEERSFITVYRGVFPFLDKDGALQRLAVIISPIDTRV